MGHSRGLAGASVVILAVISLVSPPAQTAGRGTSAHHDSQRSTLEAKFPELRDIAEWNPSMQAAKQDSQVVRLKTIRDSLTATHKAKYGEAPIPVHGSGSDVDEISMLDQKIQNPEEIRYDMRGQEKVMGVKMSETSEPTDLEPYKPIAIPYRQSKDRSEKNFMRFQFADSTPTEEVEQYDFSRLDKKYYLLRSLTGPDRLLLPKVRSMLQEEVQEWWDVTKVKPFTDAERDAYNRYRNIRRKLGYLSVARGGEGRKEEFLIAQDEDIFDFELKSEEDALQTTERKSRTKQQTFKCKSTRRKPPESKISGKSRRQKERKKRLKLARKAASHVGLEKKGDKLHDLTIGNKLSLSVSDVSSVDSDEANAAMVGGGDTEGSKDGEEETRSDMYEIDGETVPKRKISKNIRRFCLERQVEAPDVRRKDAGESLNIGGPSTEVEIPTATQLRRTDIQSQPEVIPDIENVEIESEDTESHLPVSNHTKPKYGTWLSVKNKIETWGRELKAKRARRDRLRKEVALKLARGEEVDEECSSLFSDSMEWLPPQDTEIDEFNGTEPSDACLEVPTPPIPVKHTEDGIMISEPLFSHTPDTEDYKKAASPFLRLDENATSSDLDTEQRELIENLQKGQFAWEGALFDEYGFLIKPEERVKYVGGAVAVRYQMSGFLGSEGTDGESWFDLEMCRKLRNNRYNVRVKDTFESRLAGLANKTLKNLDGSYIRERPEKEIGFYQVISKRGIFLSDTEEAAMHKIPQKTISKFQEGDILYVDKIFMDVFHVSEPKAGWLLHIDPSTTHPVVRPCARLPTWSSDPNRRFQRSKTEHFRLKVFEYNLKVIRAIPPTFPRGKVLLLSGYNRNAEDWEKNGFMERLYDRGYAVVALDLPGEGESHGEFGVGEVQVKSQLMRVLIEGLGLDPVFIISPSSSSWYALPYALYNPTQVQGLVNLSPLSWSNHTKEDMLAAPFPTLIFRGEMDGRAAIAAKMMRLMPKAEDIVIPKENYLFWANNTETWTERTIKLLDELNDFHSIKMEKPGVILKAD